MFSVSVSAQAPADATVSGLATPASVSDWELPEARLSETFNLKVLSLGAGESDGGDNRGGGRRSKEFLMVVV